MDVKSSDKNLDNDDKSASVSLVMRLFWILIAVRLVTFLGLCISPYLNYGGESMTIFALMRIQEGLTYVSDIKVPPHSINSYSPYFYWIISLPLKLLSVNNLMVCALIARIFVVLCAVMLFWAIRQCAARLNFPKLTPFILFLFAWLSVSWPGDFLSIKPDLLALNFEFFAFYYFCRYWFEADKRFLLPVAVLLAASFIIKINVVGIAFGIFIFLLLEKRLASAVSIALLSLMIASISGYIAYYSLGDRFLINSIYSLDNFPFEFDSYLKDVVIRIAYAIVLRQSIFFMLLIVGLKELSVRNPVLMRLLMCCMGPSFFMACFGQLKFGASVNYYFEFFVLGMIPAAIGLQYVLSRTRDYLTWAIRVIIGLDVIVRSAVAGAFLVAILFNDLVNYPYEDVRAYLTENFPGKLVYAQQPNVALHFYRRIPLAPWSEGYLEITPSLIKYLPRIKSTLETDQLAAVIIAGGECAKWQPSGLFVEQLNDFTHLSKEIGKICVFTR